MSNSIEIIRVDGQCSIENSKLVFRNQLDSSQEVSGSITYVEK